MSDSVFNHTGYNCRSAEQVLPTVFSLVHPASVVDIGCGLGTWLHVAKQMGAQHVHGYDGDYVDQDKLLLPATEFTAVDLTTLTRLDHRYDLAICLEVAEHLPAAVAAQLVQLLCVHGKVVLFSAAIPEQGGQYHINEQWPAYWQPLFAAHGYYPFDTLRSQFWNNSEVDWWYRQNMLYYAPASFEQVAGVAPVAEVMPLVHPVHYQSKLDQLHHHRGQHDQLYETAVMRPAVYPALRRFAKAIVQKLF